MICDKCNGNRFEYQGDYRVDSGIRKKYYLCSFCGCPKTELLDESKEEIKRKLEGYFIEPDLWWEELPEKQEHVDKSKGDPWNASHSINTNQGDINANDDTCNYTSNPVISSSGPEISIETNDDLNYINWGIYE